MAAPESENPGWNGFPIAVYWDASLVWGMICVETLQRLDIPFHLLSGEDIAGGRLGRYRVLLVPGGWASHKLSSLGQEGKDAVHRFVREGGSYIGFCGGAGLALSSPPSLGMAPLGRMPLSERLPSASGNVKIRLRRDGNGGFPLGDGLPELLSASIWWPSQFQWPSDPPPGLCRLATYEDIGEDFCVSDLPAVDLECSSVAWKTWEKIYGINLDPARLMNQPAIVAHRCSKGLMILSYPHLETPGSVHGNLLLVELLERLDAEAARTLPAIERPEPPPCDVTGICSEEAVERFAQMRACAEQLVRFGERHLFWVWRTPWLLRWRRGVRGLEYGSLAVMMRFLASEAERLQRTVHETPPAPGSPCTPDLRVMEEETMELCSCARRLLMEEKLVTQTGHLRKLGSVNDSVDGLRASLFGARMNPGGLCQALFDKLDVVLLHALRRRALIQATAATTHPPALWPTI